jgi:5-methylcytosine-specific restriction endonuclease McrA
MTKKQRQEVYQKYDGHCAYCGKEIEFKDMQVDHIKPKRNNSDHIEDEKNKNPACRRCNHYKRAHTLETFRHMLETLHERVRKVYINNVAEDYGIIKVQEWDGKFYFKKVDKGV